MEGLKGKEIFVGREPQRHRLLIAFTDDGQIKKIAIGKEGSVPNSVSCCKPEEQIAHCKIAMDQDDVMSIHNLKPQNVTYVNDVEIVAKGISAQCKVALGNDQYLVDVNEVLDAVRSVLGYSIKHLEEVWEKYDEDLYRLQKQQKRLGLIKSFYMPCTVISGLAGLAFKYIGLDAHTTEIVSMVMYIIAAIVLFYGLYKTATDKSLEERKALDRKFQEDYVCPSCKHFLGFQAYRILRQNDCCPYKRCKWVE